MIAGQGDWGDQGDLHVGDQGEQCDQGDLVDQGDLGDQGDQVDLDDQGDLGDQGDLSDSGDQGDTVLFTLEQCQTRISYKQNAWLPDLLTRK